MRSASLFLVALTFLFTACMPLSKQATVHDDWQVDIFTDMGIALERPADWVPAFQDGMQIYRDPTDTETTIMVFHGNTWKEEMEERILGDASPSVEEKKIDGGFVTVLSFMNEGTSRYRDYLFRVTKEDSANVIIAQMIATVPNDEEGLPDFSQRTLPEDILETIRLLPATARP